MGLLALATASACGNVKTSPDAAVPDDAAAIDAPPNCAIGATARCVGDMLETCDGAGNVTGSSACDLGCNATENRCNKVAPSNGLATFLDEAATAPDLTLIGSATIDTTAGTITDTTGARVVPMSQIAVGAGVPVDVLVVKVKSFATGGNVTVTGNRALAIVADGTVTVEHPITANAVAGTNGPGAMMNDATCRGGNGGPANSEGDGGGGGGGFGGPGGAGGSGGSPTVAGGSAGQVSGTADLIPLRGGCPGGRASRQLNGYAGGGGGGAIQLTSNTSIALTSTGRIVANGAGGFGPGGTIFCIMGNPCGNGEGGGSGGAVLLEAPSVSMEAGSGIYVNGGGGSCALAGSGQDGQVSTTPAAGETCVNQTGSGGNGGAGMLNALNGQSRIGNDGVGGGGGGGRGRVRINVPAGETFNPAGTVSGVLSVGALTTR